MHNEKKSSVKFETQKNKSAHADADNDEETAFDNYFSPEAGHRARPEGPTNA